MSQHITAYPLTWPDGWKREQFNNDSRFGTWRNKPSVHDATRFVLEQLRMMGIDDWNVIISTNLELRQDGLPRSNQRHPGDDGAAVWWKDEGGKQKVLAIDKYNQVGCNIYAIGKTLEAMRGIARWGGGEILERTFTGFTALPETATTPWRDVLEYHGSDIEQAKAAYLRARKAAHPDAGGTPERFQEVQQAWIQASSELAA